MDDIRRIARTASQHGLKGIVLAGGLDRLDLQPPHYSERLSAVKQVCAEHEVEIIPLIFSVGYGGSVLAHDRNLAAGIPVRGARYVVDGNQAVFRPDPTAGRVPGHRRQSRPGEREAVGQRLTLSLCMGSGGIDRCARESH